MSCIIIFFCALLIQVQCRKCRIVYIPAHHDSGDPKNDLKQLTPLIAWLCNSLEVASCPRCLPPIVSILFQLRVAAYAMMMRLPNIITFKASSVAVHGHVNLRHSAFCTLRVKQSKNNYKRHNMRKRIQRAVLVSNKSFPIRSRDLY